MHPLLPSGAEDASPKKKKKRERNPDGTKKKKPKKDKKEKRVGEESPGAWADDGETAPRVTCVYVFRLMSSGVYCRVG